MIGQLSHHCEWSNRHDGRKYAGGARLEHGRQIGILLVWALALMLMPDLTYRTQSLVTKISREEFDRLMYTMMGHYKTALFVTHLGPYIALRIVFT